VRLAGAYPEVSAVKIRTRLMLGLLLLCFAAPVQAREDSDEKKIRGYYRLYLRRTPNRAEVRAWMKLIDSAERNMRDVQVSLLGSKEYFNRHKGKVRPFIRGLYDDVLDRRAKSSEVDNWETAYNNAKGDREKLARLFLNAAKKEREARRDD